MNVKQFEGQLVTDEGKCLMTYRDSRGNLTVGVGHLCGLHDGLREGYLITEAQCQAFLAADISAAIVACHRLVQGFDAYPEVSQQVLANMAFNLGESRLRLFTHMLDAFQKQQWQQVVLEMRQSKWYHQVGDRAKRLCDRILTQVSAKGAEVHGNGT